jgi:DNA-binding NtrC family response regulator
MPFGKFRQLREHLGNRGADEEHSPQKPLIQVIDDDLRIRQGIQLSLQKRYRVRLCATGEEGIQMVDGEVSVIILDMKMSGKNGLQVYDAIKTKFPEIPIIFYSAYQGGLDGAEVSRTYHPFSYIDKSADVQELLDTIEHAVTYSKTIRQVTQPA